MTPYEQARQIVEEYAPQGAPVNRKALIDAIRWAIIRADIEKRQPRELPASEAGSIVYQILYFVDGWIARFRHLEYPRQANELAACRRKIVAILEEKPELEEVPKARKAHA